MSDGNIMLLEYGPDKSRVLSDIQGVRKYYVDNLFEQKIDNDKISNINYIFAFGKAVAIVTEGVNTDIKYLHHDHLGSIQDYTDEAGLLYQDLSYDAWGLRRSPDNWVVFDVLTSSHAFDEHGFGGHEHLDLFDLVNMDGRMYDPVVGRFISADPFIQSPDFTQSLNRYAYCINNPLSLIDPSGYSWFSKNWKSLVASVVGVAVSVATAGSGSGIGVAIIAGAAGGAAGALTGALLNGANIGQIAKSTFTGAFWGGLAGAANNLAGDINEFWLRIGAHTLSEGTMEGLQGGNMLHGFMMGATSSLGGSFIDNNLESLGKVGEVTANSILSGTVDEIGGGKFANGAITGAFTVMFNDMMHGSNNEGKGKKRISVDENNQNAGQLAGALVLAGTALVADDVTGFGIVDDPIAAFFYIAAGTVYTYDVVQSIISNYNTKKIYVMPMAAEHTKNKSKRNWDKHTNPRAGKQTGQQRNAKRGSRNQKHEHPINPNKRK